MSQNIKNLPVGAKVKFGSYSVNNEAASPLVWLVVAKNHSCTPAYPSNSVTLLTEKIIDLRAADAREMMNPESAYEQSGNNRYSWSNIDQWLNSSGAAGTWFNKAHTYDYPPQAGVVEYGTEYANHSGFLNLFTNYEKSAIIPTDIKVLAAGTPSMYFETIKRSVFLPSCAEVALYPYNREWDEGAIWEYFTNSTDIESSRKAYLSQAAFDNSLSTQKPSLITTAWDWLLRTPLTSTVNNFNSVNKYGQRANYPAYFGSTGIRPAINVYDTISVSDSVDESGCYVVIPNSAPAAPISIAPYSSLWGGNTVGVLWGSSIDPDGDAVSYELEVAYNDSSDFTRVYNGTFNSTEVLIASTYLDAPTTSAIFRVRAVDSAGEASEYCVSQSFPIQHNNVPVITDNEEDDLGTLNAYGYEIEFSVEDTLPPGTTKQTFIFRKYIDGVLLETREILGSNGFYEEYFEITHEELLKLPNGKHTLSYTVEDGLGAISEPKQHTFTKNITKISVMTRQMESTTRASRISVSVIKACPEGAIFKVEVCNNAFDGNKIVWEDATDSVLNRTVHVFSNTTVTNALSKWGVMVRVTIDRNNAEGLCYLGGIGGNFE